MEYRMGVCVSKKQVELKVLSSAQFAKAVQELVDESNGQISHLEAVQEFLETNEEVLQAVADELALTGKKAKDADGNIGEAYDISIGGSQGKEQKIGKLIHKAIPKSGLKRVLKDILIKEFKAIPKTNNLLDEKNLRHRIINSLSEIKDNSNSS